MAAPVLDTVSHGVQDYGVGAVTIAHTCSGEDRVLIAIATNGYTAGYVDTVTYDGLAMTLATSLSGHGPSANVYIYYLLDPPVGNHNIVWTSFSTTSLLNFNHFSFTGCGGIGNDAKDISATAAAPRSINVTSSSADSLILDAICGTNSGISAFIVGDGQTQLAQNTHANVGAMSTKIAGGTGPITMSWTYDGTHQVAQAGIELLSTSTPVEEDPTGFTTDIIINNTGTPQTEVELSYTLFPSGRVGELEGVVGIDGTGTTDEVGRLTVTDLPVPAGQGLLLVSIQGATVEDDAVYYEIVTIE